MYNYTVILKRGQKVRFRLSKITPDMIGIILGNDTSFARIKPLRFVDKEFTVPMQKGPYFLHKRLIVELLED